MSLHSFYSSIFHAMLLIMLLLIIYRVLAAIRIFYETLRVAVCDTIKKRIKLPEPMRLVLLP